MRLLLRITSAAAAALLLAGCAAVGTQRAGVSPASAQASPLAVASDVSSLEQQFEAVVQRVSPSVVLIANDSGLGSGVVFDSGGHFVTNAHAVAGSSSLQVRPSNGRSYSATLEAQFGPDDLTVIKTDVGQLRPAAFADSHQLKVGSIVMAIGNPLGLQSSATMGIVSALGRQVVEPRRNALPPAIQTSADINPGNSGGALVNLKGEVVGIPTLAAQDPLVGGTAPGSVSQSPAMSSKTSPSRSSATAGASAARAYLGIQSAGITGGGVLEVIVTLGGTAITDPVTLSSVLAGIQPGQNAEVVLIGADGVRRSTTVALGEMPGGSSS